MEWLTIYLLGASVGYVLSLGWFTAKLNHEFPAESWENLGISMIGSLLVAMLWPMALPAIYFFTERARYGWVVLPTKEYR